MALASLTPEQKQQRARSVQDMIDNHYGWQLVARHVQKDLDDKLELVTRGKLGHDEYLRECGYIQGLRSALKAPSAIITQAGLGLHHQKGQE